MRKGETDLTDSAESPVGTMQTLLAALRGILGEEGRLKGERDLSERLGVKRHTLRKALQLLREKGEIDMARAGRPRSSSTPQRRAPSTRMVLGTNPLEVWELRMVLEPGLARLAALRASPAEIERIIAVATTPAGMAASQADHEFHRTIAASTRNALAHDMFLILDKVRTDSRLRFAPSDEATTAERLAQRDAEHRQIAAAIAARDPDLAEQAMRDHLAVIHRKIVARLSMGLSEDAA